MMIRPFRLPHLFTDGKSIFTRNLVHGKSVYGEKLVSEGGVEYRLWDPRRSKLAALLHKGCALFPFELRSTVLYLGAASGTTVSHISDISVDGLIYSIEISPRPFRKLMRLSGERENIVPILADANNIQDYQQIVVAADILYQDIAQRNQAEIFIENTSLLKDEGMGYIMVKARSIDVTSNPRSVYRKVERKLESCGLEVLEKRELSPYEKDHVAMVVQKS